MFERSIIASVLLTTATAAVGGEPDGTCCTGEGTCVPGITAAICTLIDGAYQGDGTTCGGVTCTPFGGCCVGGALCTIETAPACAGAGGQYIGDASSCETLGACAFTSGACCLDDGTCTDNVDFGQCVDLAGTYRGYMSVCADVSCTGACSFDDGSCAETSLAGCAAAFLGLDTACADFAHPAEAHSATFDLPHNGEHDFVFPPFDTRNGARRLERVAVELADVNVTRVFILANYLRHPVESTVREEEHLAFSLPALGVRDETLLDVLEHISCTPLVLPPNEACDYGGPLVHPVTFAADSIDPAELAAFVAADEIGAALIGQGFVKVWIDPHVAFSKARVSGTIRLVYEYTPVPCPCDIDPDGNCGFEDLLLVIGSWGSGTTAADIDGDGVIGFRDLLIVISGWGACP